MYFSSISQSNRIEFAGRNCNCIAATCHMVSISVALNPRRALQQQTASSSSLACWFMKPHHFCGSWVSSLCFSLCWQIRTSWFNQLQKRRTDRLSVTHQCKFSMFAKWNGTGLKCPVRRRCLLNGIKCQLFCSSHDDSIGVFSSLVSTSGAKWQLHRLSY